VDLPNDQQSPDVERDDSHNRALTALLAEYSFVSGLIPFYRGVEVRALTALGLTVGAIATIFATLAEQRQASTAALAGVLTLATWIFVLFVTIELNSSLRIKRASTYIHKFLYPQIHAIAPGANLSWESITSMELIGIPDSVRWSNARNRLRSNLVTSGPLSIGIGLAGLLVGVMAVIFVLGTDRNSWAPGIALTCGVLASIGGALSGFLGFYGYRLTHSVERNSLDQPRR
jgi:hypothetical protein